MNYSHYEVIKMNENNKNNEYKKAKICKYCKVCSNYPKCKQYDTFVYCVIKKCDLTSNCICLIFKR